jgi:hypothetical protein
MKDFRERCQQAVANQVDMLFEKNRARAITNLSSADRKSLILEAPIIKLLYSAIDDELIAMLKTVTCDAVVAWQRYDESKPPGLPGLPVNSVACNKLLNERDYRLQLLGKYGGSQRGSLFDKGHPSIRDFNCGIMANEHTPKWFREDPELLREFPPKWLDGLSNHKGSFWYTDDTLFAWCKLTARIKASITHRLGDPDYQTSVVNSLLRQFEMLLGSSVWSCLFVEAARV